MNLSGRQTKKCLLKIRKRSSSREIRPCSETFSAFSCAPIPGMEIDMLASILEIKFMDSVFMTSSMVTFTKDLGTKGISKVMRCIPFRKLATVNGMEATSTPVFPLLQMQFFVQFSRLPEKQLKRRSTFIDEQVNKAEVSKNIDLVYGGGSIGLMGLVSQAVHDGGRHVIGMIPKMLMR